MQGAVRRSWVNIGCNLALAGMKLGVGLWSGSAALVSDAAHSAADTISAVVVLIGIRAGGKAADREHPFGHERMECVAAIVLAAMLAATGLGVGADAIGRVAAARSGALAMPGPTALMAAALSVLVKEWMFFRTRRTAFSTGSGALMADAWHHHSDALGSLGGFLGILGARLGLPVLDPLAGLVICALVLKAALDIFREAVRNLTDTACEPELEAQIRRLALGQPGVLAIRALRTRRFGSRAYAELVILSDAGLSLAEATAVGRAVHDCIEAEVSAVKHCLVQVYPE